MRQTNNWMRCPFRITVNGDMRECYGENCMAFRKATSKDMDLETYWCALIIKQENNEIDSIKYKDDI